MEPIAKWNGINVSDVSDLHWWSQFEDKYIVEVRRTLKDTQGLFCFFDHNQDDKLIHAELVTITKGSIITPNVSDFTKWDKISEKIIERINKCLKKPPNK